MNQSSSIMTENSSVNAPVNSAEDAISPPLEANDGANVHIGEGRSDLEGKQRKPIPWKGVSTLVGCLLTHLTLGAFYTYGNFTTYTTSFMRNCSSPGLLYSEAFWVTPTIGGCQGLSMYFGGLLGSRFGNRFPILTGALLMSGANFLSFWTIKNSFGLFLLTYGFLQGTGVGLAYASPLKICCQWFPDHKGLINGAIVAGFGSGAAIFNQVITKYLNTHDLKPSHIGEDGKSYFVDEEILIKVPRTFLVLGACYLSMQMTGLLLMFEPNGQKGKLNQFFCRFKVEIRKRSRAASEFQTLESTLDSPVEKEKTAETFHQRNYKPKEMLKTWNFWMLYMTFFCNGMGITYMAGFYKIYGQQSKFDDQYLATVGSISAVANGLGRIMWGKIADLTNYKTSMVCCAATNMILMLTFNVVPLVGQHLYGFYVFAIYLAFSGTFSLMPTASARTFGVQSMAENYGLLFSNSVPQCLLSAAISKKLLEVEWYGQFWIITAFYFISFVLAILYPTKTSEGVKI